MSDIYLSGEINQYAASAFAYELQWHESPLTVHINSAGGDPFSAIAIGHAIRHSGKDITINVAGLCASAAVLILCSGSKVTSAFNSLFMIHGVSALLEDSYNLEELEKVKNSLEKVQATMKATLDTRLKDADLSKEQWLSADEALAMGLIDEILPAQVDIKTDNKQQLMFVNGCFFNFKGKKMPEVQASMDANKIRASVRGEELKRMRELQKLKCDNSAVNAIIDLAIEKGHSVADVKEYVDAVKKASLQLSLQGLFFDQKQSGADSVTGGGVSSDDYKAAQIQRIINAANGVVANG